MANRNDKARDGKEDRKGGFVRTVVILFLLVAAAVALTLWLGEGSGSLDFSYEGFG